MPKSRLADLPCTLVIIGVVIDDVPRTIVIVVVLIIKEDYGPASWLAVHMPCQ